MAPRKITDYSRPMIKENAQFIFLCYPQKSGTSRVCIIFLQTAQKELFKVLLH